MATAASLALMKGKPKTAPPESPAPEPSVANGTVAAAEEDMEVDIASLDLKGVTALVKEQGIETPATWAKMKLAEKKTWLEAHFAEADEEADVGNGEDVANDKASEAAVEAPAPKKVGKAAKPAGDDLIVTTSKELENLGEADARSLVSALRETSEFSFFKLGGVLSVIQKNGWFSPHASFKEFVENEHGMHYRRAMHWIEIYDGLVDAEIPWSEVKHLGWTKLNEIVAVLTSKNVKQMVKLAEKQTVLQLHETVKNMKAKKKEGADAAGDTEDNVPDSEPSAVTTKTFKVHDDQRKTIEAALDKAKKAGNTTVDTVALEAICLDYLAGNGGMPVEKLLGKMALEDAIAVFEKAFPQASLEVTIEEAA